MQITLIIRPGDSWRMGANHVFFIAMTDATEQNGQSIAKRF